MQLQTDSGKLVVKNQWPAIFLAGVFAYMIIDCFIGVYGVQLWFSKKATKIWKKISHFCFDVNFVAFLESMNFNMNFFL